MTRRFRVECLLAFALAILPIVAAHAVDIAPPKAQLVDRFGVNMTNGQISQSLDTVSIGSAMGLSHSISIDANEFNYSGYKGFRDKFFGQARNETISTDSNFTPQNVLRVFDFSETVEFEYWTGGSSPQNAGWGLTSGYTYKSHGDPRHTLDWDTNFLYWTKPDGTVVRYSRGSGDAASSALLVDITYPNGFRIEVTSAGMSVNTNTGFQLKALYPIDNRPLDKTDKPYLQNAPPANSATWAQANPGSIKGINNAFEYCLATATSCSLSNSWPTATFIWPAGMPRTMFLGDTSVSVVDSLGRTTTLSYRAYDQVYVNMQGGAVVAGETLDRKYSPRLIGLSTAGSPRQFTYDYRNVWEASANDFGIWDVQLRTSGVVVSATRLGSSSGYDTLGRYYDDLLPQAYGSGGVSKVQIHAHTPDAIGPMYYAETQEGVFNYENSARNFLESYVPTFGARQDLTYERGNVKRITYQQQVPAQTTYVEATYPSDCISTSRKTCNQPTSIRDARGNYTYYTYHAASGQIESIRRPPGNHVPAIYPETHFEYQQLSAHYYSAANGAWVAGSPIYMKVAERHCINSNYSSRLPSATCGLADEVVTRYEYNNNNLLLTGMTVTTPDGTHRTCYQYDKYGNQIGKTEPNANLSACN